MSVINGQQAVSSGVPIPYPFVQQTVVDVKHRKKAKLWGKQVNENVFFPITRIVIAW